MTIARQHLRISRLLSRDVKRKVLAAAPRFLQQARWQQTAAALHQAATDALRVRFPSASAGEIDVLAFYLIARVAGAAAPSQWPEGDDRRAVYSLDPGPLETLSEMTSLRLRVLMDRRSKFISTLSSMMGKISTTQDTLVQNLK